MNANTQACFDAIREAAAAGQKIAPVSFSWAFGRSASSVAFRKARASGLIEVAYISVAGTPVYVAAGTKDATAEAPTATKH